MELFDHMVPANGRVSAAIPGLDAFALVVVEGVQEPGKPVPRRSFRRAANASIRIVEAVARGHEVDEQFVGRQAPPHDEEAKNPSRLGACQGEVRRLRTIRGCP